MKTMTTAILAITLIATEFAYVAHERAQNEAIEGAFKLLVFEQALRGALPQAPQTHKPVFPGGAEKETL
jgi:hypothetical protein